MSERGISRRRVKRVKDHLPLRNFANCRSLVIISLRDSLRKTCEEEKVGVHVYVHTSDTLAAMFSIFIFPSNHRSVGCSNNFQQRNWTEIPLVFKRVSLFEHRGFNYDTRHSRRPIHRESLRKKGFILNLQSLLRGYISFQSTTIISRRESPACRRPFRGEAHRKHRANECALFDKNVKRDETKRRVSPDFGKMKLFPDWKMPTPFYPPKMGDNLPPVTRRN